MDKDTLLVGLLAGIAYLVGLYIGYAVLYQTTDINWVQNAPLATHTHKDKICFEWEGKYKTQVVSCIKRGN